jgi:hypothetical protein
MKLAEALIQRADYQRRIEQLRNRIVNNAKVQEGNEPAEDPNALLAEMERVAGDLVLLIQRINRTNAATALEPDDMTIADAIAERDNLRLRHGVYMAAAEAGVIRQDRYSKSGCVSRALSTWRICSDRRMTWRRRSASWTRVSRARTGRLIY